MFITKDSSGLIQVWNVKPVKHNDGHGGFTYGSYIEKGIEVSDVHEFFVIAEQGTIKEIYVDDSL